MEQFDYKKFTKEEEKIYDQAIINLRKALKDGLSYKEACASLDISDQEFKALIADDFLKICLVEMHYEKNMSLKEIALKLSIPHEDVIKMHEIILEDVSLASVAQYHKEMSSGQA
ncbi:MAG: hypothetical protein HQK91_10320 [Nitrospirae bacterium]|nr:hypothetical protein [Nitrospirota bacterium]